MNKRSKHQAELKKLQAEWYARLKDEGFNDIEQWKEDGGEEPKLKAWHSCYFQLRHDPETFKIKAEYYYRAAQFLESHRFENQTYRQIWHLHVEGRGVRQIAEYLGRTGIKIGHDRVAQIVRSVKELMARQGAIQTQPEPIQKKEVTAKVWTQMSLFDVMS